MLRLLLIPALLLTSTLLATSNVTACPADVDNSQQVDVNDLLSVISSWGECPDDSACPADIDANGQVDVNDLLTVISAWGACPTSQDDKRIVAYYIEWGIYGRAYHPM